MYKAVKICHDLWSETTEPCLDLVPETTQTDLQPSLVLSKEEIVIIIIETVEEIKEFNIRRGAEIDTENKLSKKDEDPFGFNTIRPSRGKNITGVKEV